MAETTRLLNCKRIDAAAAELALRPLISQVEQRPEPSDQGAWELRFVTGFRGKTWRGQRVRVFVEPKGGDLVQVVVRSEYRWFQPFDLGEPQEVAEIAMDRLVAAVQGERTV